MYQFEGWSETFQNHIENKGQNNSTTETVLLFFLKNVFGGKKNKIFVNSLFNVQSDTPMIY